MLQDRLVDLAREDQLAGAAAGLDLLDQLGHQPPHRRTVLVLVAARAARHEVPVQRGAVVDRHPVVGGVVERREARRLRRHAELGVALLLGGRGEATAATDLAVPFLRSRGAVRSRDVLRIEPVVTPLAHVAEHVEEPPGVRLLEPHRVRLPRAVVGVPGSQSDIEPRILADQLLVYRPDQS